MGKEHGDKLIHLIFQFLPSLWSLGGGGGRLEGRGKGWNGRCGWTQGTIDQRAAGLLSLSPSTGALTLVRPRGCCAESTLIKSAVPTLTLYFVNELNDRKEWKIKRCNGNLKNCWNISFNPIVQLKAAGCNLKQTKPFCCFCSNGHFILTGKILLLLWLLLQPSTQFPRIQLCLYQTANQSESPCPFSSKLLRYSCQFRVYPVSPCLHRHNMLP